MKRRWRIAIATVATVGIAATIVVTTSSNEPEYEGRTLTGWLTYDHKPDPAEQLRHTEAILKIGTNALPTFIQWIQYNPPPWTRIGESIAIKIGLIKFDSRTRRIARMSQALRILGSDAAPAIPALTNLALRTDQPDIARNAIFALGYIGDPGSVALTTLQNNTNVLDQPAIRAALRMHQTLDRVSPNLARCLNDPDPKVRKLATNVLREVAPNLLTNAVGN